jgi:hypothetical protein
MADTADRFRTRRIAHGRGHSASTASRRGPRQAGEAPQECDKTQITTTDEVKENAPRWYRLRLKSVNTEATVEVKLTADGILSEHGIGAHGLRAR